MLYLQLHDEELTHPVTALESYFHAAGVTIIQAAFTHSYFIHPDSVREKTPYFPERARFSRQHYPGVSKGQAAVWTGDGREVLIDDNQHAQTGLGEVYRTQARPRHRLLHTSHLGAPLEPGRLHGRMEHLLHALLGGNANGKTAPPRGTGEGNPPSLLGPVLPEQPGVRATGLRGRPGPRPQLAPGRSAAPDPPKEHPRPERPGSSPECQARRTSGGHLRVHRNRREPDPPEPDQHLQGKQRQFQAGTPKLRRTHPAHRSGTSGLRGVSGCVVAEPRGLDRGVISGWTPGGASLGCRPHESVIQRHWEPEKPTGVSGWRMAAERYHRCAGEANTVGGGYAGPRPSHGYPAGRSRRHNIGGWDCRVQRGRP